VVKTEAVYQPVVFGRPGYHYRTGDQEDEDVVDDDASGHRRRELWLFPWPWFTGAGSS
jgi:hypothetical protein